MEIAGLVVVLAAGWLMFVFSVLARRKRFQIPLRSIQVFHRLQRSIGLAVEDGRRIHVSLGNSRLTSDTNASAWLGLSTLERLAQMSMASDLPPLATSGAGALSLLTQDTLRAICRRGNALGQFSPSSGRLAGVTPFSYMAGTLPMIRDERISTHVMVGNYGSEVALLCEAAEQENAFVLAASDDLAAQAVIYGIVQESLIGEELFAIPAYLQAGTMHCASVRTQDFLRWIVIVVLVLSALLSYFGLT
jgi:hypothetical protein